MHNITNIWKKYYNILLIVIFLSWMFSIYFIFFAIAIAIAQAIVTNILYLCMFVDNEARTKTRSYMCTYICIYYIYIYHCCNCRLHMLSHVVSFPISSVRCRLHLTVRIQPRTSVVTGRTAKYSGKSLPCQLTWKTGGRYTILVKPHTKSHLMERYDSAVFGVLRGMSH